MWAGIPCRMLVAGETPNVELPRAAPLALSSPLGKPRPRETREDVGEEREPERNRGGCALLVSFHIEQAYGPQIVRVSQHRKAGAEGPV